MYRLPVRLFASAILLAVATTSVEAQRPRGDNGARGIADLSDAGLVNTVGVRSIGPAVMSGRVVDIAVADAPAQGVLGTVIYIAAASGGVWKSTSAGVAWDPVFDEGGVGSIGDIAVAPSDPNIVWIGTGESNNQRSSSYGDGVYKSVDAGETFEHMGLRTSQHTGRIVIHPDDPNVVFVAATGPMWAAGGERGIYRTVDGGASWEQVLYLDEHTGGIDLVMDPTNPDVLYAALQQRERRAYSYISGGPGSGIWKSTDGGDNWTRLTEGLPSSHMGRIGLDVSASSPWTVYAVIEGSEAGVYRSDNGGESWRQTDDIASIPWYFGEIRVDPTDPEVVYHLGVPLMRSEDGGETWTRAASGGVHVDNHAMWINPENPRHLLLGNDGGFYQSRDYGETWDFSPNLPVSQFYAIGYDMREPFFHVYGGLQDNNTWGGPSRTRATVGIPNASWYVMAGGDGFYAAVDPTDHNIAYVESQNGNIVRFDGRTGERKSIRPQPAPGEMPYRFNWSAPIKISPFDSNTLYFAANHVFKSTDRGDSWTRLGEDLTRAIDRDSLPMFGRIPDSDAVSRHQGTAIFSNISSMDVSPITPGLLITGSDDGTIAISTDDGMSWNKRTRFPDVPDTTYVSKVRASKHDSDVFYATFDGHRSNDFTPYVLKSDDQGGSWESIAADLPAFGSVRAFAEHHENPNLLFVGTEIAPYVSIDGGASWIRITNGMPPVRVDDIKVHPRDNALIIGTHGRGIFLVDDLLPWQQLAEAKASGGPFLFDVASTLQFVPDISRRSGLGASRDYSAPNPEFGANVAVYVPEGAGGDLALEIVDPRGGVVRELEVPSGAGLHHVRWDLRVEPPWSGPAQQAQGGGGFGGGFGFGGGGTRSAPAVPGSYTARLTVEGDSVGDGSMSVQESPFVLRKDANVTLSDAQLRELHDLRMRHYRLNARLQMANRSVTQIRRSLTEAREAMDEVDVPEALTAQHRSVREAVDAINRELRGQGGGGFGGGARRPVPDPRPIQQRLQIAAGLHRATAMPTEQERDALESVPADLNAAIGRLNDVIESQLPDLLRAMDEAGVPWTPGRPIRAIGG